MKRFLLALLLSASIAHSQTVTPSFNKLRFVRLNKGLDTKLSIGADSSTRKVLPLGSSVPQTLASLVSEQSVIADWYRLPADGTDDAPSIVRAQATGARVGFRCRNYAIKSAIPVTTPARWQGCGWQELTLGSASPGTWFDQDASFQVSPVAGANAGQSAIQFGAGSSGSTIEGVGFSQPQPLPTPGVAAWSPNLYAHVISATNVLGRITIRNVMWGGIYQGVYSDLTGRTELDHNYGQVFLNLFRQDRAYDVSRLTDIHLFPFWCDCTQVEAWQQAAQDTIVSGRSDTPFYDRLFVIFARSFIRLVDYGNGVTTGAQFDLIQCDQVVNCIWSDRTAYVPTFQVGMLRSFSQLANRGPQYASGSISGTTLTVTAIDDSSFAVSQQITGAGIASSTMITALGTGTGGLGTYTVSVSQTVANTTIATIAPVVMLASSGPLHVDGAIRAELGSVVDFGSTGCAVNLTNSASASDISMTALRIDNVAFAAPNSAIVCAPTTGTAHRVQLATMPKVFGTRPAGYRYLTAFSPASFLLPTMAAAPSTMP